MKVLVFDIDGTLISTNSADGQLLQAAISPVIPGATLESFQDFPEQTDSAILREMCGFDPGLDYAAAEAQVQEGFGAGIKAALEANPDFFLPIPGALDVFGKVREVGWTPAVATGGWRPSAELRLSAAGIPMAGVPLETASEAIHRADIIRLAATQAGSGIEPTEIVYVGDGAWDVPACRELSIGFIGRASPDARAKLSAQGARTSIPDFNVPEGLFQLLSDPEALIPTGGSV